VGILGRIMALLRCAVCFCHRWIMEPGEKKWPFARIQLFQFVIHNSIGVEERIVYLNSRKL
jgi:hypothetical protein